MTEFFFTKGDPGEPGESGQAGKDGAVVSHDTVHDTHI